MMTYETRNPDEDSPPVGPDPEPGRRLWFAIATTGASPALAAAVAAGAFGSATSARAVARRWGLLMVETDAARRAGLLQ